MITFILTVLGLMIGIIIGVRLGIWATKEAALEIVQEETEKIIAKVESLEQGTDVKDLAKELNEKIKRYDRARGVSS